MGEFCTTPRLFVTLMVLVVIAVGMAIAVGFLASESEETEGPAPTTPPPYVTPNPEHPCNISIEDLRLFSEGLIRRDINNVASQITVNHNTDRLLEVPASALQGPTIAAVWAMYDNYNAVVGEDEEWTNDEYMEIGHFMAALRATAVMNYTERWMKDRCLLDGVGIRDILDQVNHLFFVNYASSHSPSYNIIDSSGFEHTFLGQRTDDHVLGFNNWIYYYHQQSLGLIDYEYGDYINHIQFGEGDQKKGEIVKQNFKWHGLPKADGTMFIGTSPELELALYTVCFTIMPGKHCPLQMMNQRFELLTMDYRGMGVISVAQPILN